MPTPLFDLLLLGYRNDLARERVLAYLRSLPDSQGGPISLARDAELPQVVRAGLDHTAGLRLLGELRERGAQVRLVAGHWEPATAAPPPAAAPTPAATPAGPTRLLALLVLFGAATVAYVHLMPPPPPLPPPPTAPEYAPVAALPGQLDRAPHRLNDEAVELNAAGQFADAADKLRDAMRARSG